jgi:two-component system, sensor histidine kinase RegB
MSAAGASASAGAGAAATRDADAINFSWLLRLRWGAIAGQLITIAGVERLMRVELPLVPLGAIILVEAATNVAGVLLARRASAREWWAGALMALDTLLLTALLYFTGGAFNPFSFLYLVQIALASVMLRARWTWALVALALAGSGFLFVDARPLHIDGAGHMDVHLRGMWVAFGVAAVFIVYFLLRVRRALGEREAELAATRTIAARQEKLASLATLAAGAAHELSTPLSTIALAAKELDRKHALDDLKLIREQVERCRAILERMTADAGAPAGEGPAPASVRELVDASIAGLAARPPVAVELAAPDAARTVTLPRRAVAQAIASVVKNAQDASADDAEVRVAVACTADTLTIEVHDRGAGMPADVLARAGEPFFTTKAPGRGMGLGLFLTRAVVERLGGRVEIDSQPGRGTRATLRLPANVRA